MRAGMRRWLAVLVAPAAAAAVLAGPAVPASAAPGAAGTAAVPAALRAAIARSLGIPGFPAGYAQRAELTASDAAPSNLFGVSVALSGLGTTALVGAPGRNSGAAGAGAAYVFTLRGGAWSQTAELTASDAARFDNFGYSVALSALGTTALAGAPVRHSGAGAAYVFTSRFGAWSQRAELTASDAAPGDNLGWSVALSGVGTTALAGAPFRALARAPFPHVEAGAAYVFRPRFGTWSQAAELTASDAAPFDQLGYSVALSALGTTALAGAPGRHSGAGAAFVFTPRLGAWSQAAELTASDAASGDQFGRSVALSEPGTTALAGAFGGNAGAGAAYVFTLRGAWSQAAELTASDGAPGDSLGYSVALSALGGTALAGAPFRHGSAGAAYVFTPRFGA